MVFIASATELDDEVEEGTIDAFALGLAPMVICDSARDVIV